jgi:hypothetical protein
MLVPAAPSAVYWSLVPEPIATSPSNDSALALEALVALMMGRWAIRKRPGDSSSTLTSASAWIDQLQSR